MSTVTDTVKEFWNRGSCGTHAATAGKHSRAYFEQIEDYRYRYEPCIHQFAQFTRWHGTRMLEVGVGAGTDFLQWVRAGTRANGVDLTEEGVENVKARLDCYGLKAESLQVCNAERLPFEDDSFDLAYSWGVIHHASNMEKVFAEIYRVVKPGGRVKIMVYNLWSVHAWHCYLRYALLRGRIWRGRRWAIYNYQESIATKAYTRGDIRRLLDEYPHRDLRFSLLDPLARPGGKLEAIRYPLRLLARKLTPPSMRWFLCFEFRKV